MQNFQEFCNLWWCVWSAQGIVVPVPPQQILVTNLTYVELHEYFSHLWWENKDLIKHWILSLCLLAFHAIGNLYIIRHMLVFLSKHVMHLTPAVLKLLAEPPFSVGLFLCCSSANPKQLWGKKGKLCVTAVLLSLCPLGCGARAPEHCMFLCGDWKTWIWTCARFLTVLSLLLQMVSNNQKTWLLPLSSISHTLILDLPQQTWHYVRHVACFLSFSA